MSLIYLLSDPEIWNKFYDYKQSLACPKQFTKYLRTFIDEKRYENICDDICSGEEFPLPKRSLISKMGSDKKRVVYTYPEDHNTVLKLLTWLILRKYDGLFCRGLYSFRPGKTAKDAVRYLLKTKELHNMYAYKADIHDYFNSVPVEKLIPLLKDALSDDPALYAFLSSLLSEERVIDRGRIITEKKGIMAGTSLASFYANLFLSGLDRYFYDRKAVYVRYSDDIIVFAESREAIDAYAGHIRSYLDLNGLSINPKKECFTEPGEVFSFLGFSVDGLDVDISPVTKKKLKMKMKRKRDALKRWHRRKELPSVNAAKAFIKVFNRKLFESSDDNELCWAKWFFPVINKTESLHEIDLYAQDCIRYLISGKHTKSRFNVRYDDIKALGYRSMVHEYYSYDKEK